MIAGNINSYAWEWDASGLEDDIGNDIMDFLDENNFVIANDSYPTYHSHLNNNKEDNE